MGLPTCAPEQTGPLPGKLALFSHPHNARYFS
jgi:hypothetical protein